MRGLTRPHLVPLVVLSAKVGNTVTVLQSAKLESTVALVLRSAVFAIRLWGLLDLRKV